MTPPRRGEIWLVDFGKPVGREQSGRRPAVVVSADALNEAPAGVVMVVPCTTTDRQLPSHIEIDPDASGLAMLTFAKCEDLKSISSERLFGRIGAVGPETMFDIRRVLRFLLEL